jgi:hypothetical protein
LKLFQEWEGGKIKESSGGGESSVIHLIHCKNFYQCYNIPQFSTTVKKNIVLNIVKKNSTLTILVRFKQHFKASLLFPRSFHLLYTEMVKPELAVVK